MIAQIAALILSRSTLSPIESPSQWSLSQDRSNAYFLTLVEASDELDNWGIKVDLLHYRDLEDSLQKADAEAKK
jgi:hypothetical protein